ncbi:MAG: hypothetical protein ACYDCN_15605 [Bacteroidia bacterium]
MAIIKSKFLFILIGDDLTGKTSLQKHLVQKLCIDYYYIKLPTNKLFSITHPEIKRKYQTISFGNRSYQEKKEDYYKSVEEYFANDFTDADIAFISSHLVLADVQAMIIEGRKLFFNVIGVFFSNSIEANRVNNSDISALDWQERLYIDNPVSQNADEIANQISKIAESFVDLIINRTTIS